MHPLKRIMFIFGTRPEAVKMAPLIAEIEKHKDIFSPIVVVTAQHRHMLDQMLLPFGIKPDYDMSIMEEAQTVSRIIVKALQGFEGIILGEKPDMILVQGDTTTAFTAALSAFNHMIPVGHVEAGLRTFNKYNPFPEEMNRKLVSSLADLHFAPTRTSADNLLKEAVNRNSIFVTGNTVIDALFSVAGKPFDLSKAVKNINKDNRKIILVTTHRRESFGVPMRNTCKAIAFLAGKYKEDLKFVIPVHRNPKVRQTVNEILFGIENVIMTEPLDYIPFVHLMKCSYLVLTDSGGVQEEAPSFGKPVLVLRETTERPEAVEAGTVKIVGTDPDLIIAETEKLLLSKEEYDRMAKAVNPYGDGKASERIVQALLGYFGYTDTNVDEFVS